MSLKCQNRTHADTSLWRILRLYATTIMTDEAHVDIAAKGVWVKGQMALFDVRVFNPIPKAYLT